MLFEQIKNDYLKFKYYSSLPDWPAWDEEDRIELVTWAFLWVIQNYDAYRFPKEKELDSIVSVCPGLKVQMFQDAIFRAFKIFYQGFTGNGRILSPKELDWIKKYVTKKSILKSIERLVYESFLRGSGRWGLKRHDYEWTLDEEEKIRLACSALNGQNVSVKRRIEIAKELGMPNWMYVREYFENLLWDRQLNLAEKLAAENDDALDPWHKELIVRDVVIMNVDAMCFQDALDIAERFLPDDAELISQIRLCERLF